MTVRDTATPVRPAWREGAAFAAALAVITIVAAYLRLHGLGDASLWRDEATSWAQAQGSLGTLLAATAADNTPPLYNLLLALSMHLFGDAEWALRLPAALFGILAVPALYWVGRLASGRLVGLLAALLLALSYFHIWHSQNARTYSLLALAAILFAGSALWFMQKVNWPRGLITIGLGVVLLYSHPYGTFTWVAIAGATLVILLARTDRDHADGLTWLLLQVVIALLFLPWALLLVQRASAIVATGFWIPFPTPNYVLTTLTVVGSGFLCTLAALLLAATAFIEPATSEINNSPAGPPLKLGAPAAVWLALIWLVAPLAMALATSLIVQPILVSYYLIGSLPALLLLAAMGLARFARGALATAFVFGAALLTAAIGLAYGVPGPNEDWRSAAAFVERAMPADGCVLVGENLAAYALAYYDREQPCIIYAADVPNTKASTLFVMLVGDQSSLASTLSSPVWQHGQAMGFGQLIVLPLRRAA